LDAKISELPSMRTPRFCSECGEKITIASRKRWPGPAFCAGCAPRLRLPRLIFVAALFLCTIGGFLVGRYSGSTRPFQFIGTPINIQTGSPLSATGQEPATDSKSGNAELHASRAADNQETICGATTKSGRPCRRKVKSGGYCWQHRDKQ
jgi:uncharacterized protein DUF5763